MRARRNCGCTAIKNCGCGGAKKNPLGESVGGSRGILPAIGFIVVFVTLGVAFDKFTDRSFR